MRPLPGVNIIPIVLVSYMRPHMLRRIIKLIDQRTYYPHALIVVHNSPEGEPKAEDAEAKRLILEYKTTGEVTHYIFTEKNLGQAGGQNVGLKWVYENMPLATHIVFTQDDLEPPGGFKPCWLEKMKCLIDRHPDFGAIAMRIERTSRLNWNEDVDDLIPSMKSVPAVFRIHRVKDLRDLGDDPFAGIKRWESQLCQRLMEKLKLKQGFATRVFASHWGYSETNKGFLGDFTDYYSYSPERVNQAEVKPYPKIDPRSLEPIPNQVFLHDKEEFARRNAFWNIEVGIQNQSTTGSVNKIKQRELLGTIVDGMPGRWLEVGSGATKCRPSTVALDMWPFDGVEYVGDCFDMWWFKDGEFDGICSSHVLEHCKKPIKRALTEWNRVIRRGGLMAFIVPDAENRPDTILEPSHNYALTRGVIGELVGRFLKNDIIRLDNVPGLPTNKQAIVCVSRKR